MSTRLGLARTVGLAALAATIVAAGCGGDGSSTPPLQEQPPPPTFVRITSQNQDAVARVTAGIFYNLSGVAAVPTAAPPPAQTMGVDAVVIHALSKVIGPSKQSSDLARRLSVISQTELCLISGSMTLTLDDRDNNAQPSPGDVMSLSFVNCQDDVSTLINGTLVMNIGAISVTPALSSFTGTFAFQQLTVIDAGFTSSVNGTMNVVYSETTDAAGSTTTHMETAVASSGGLVAQGSTPQFSDTFSYDAGFGSVETAFMPASTADMGWSTIVLNGTVNVASLGGRITLLMDAAAPVHEFSDADYPDSGQVTVVGEASRLRLTVMDAVRVRMELDANNDAAYEETKEVTWAQLMP
jgi:hypothetical protein